MSRVISNPDGTIRAYGGRQIGYGEFGDPEGTPIILIHGFGDSRLTRHPDDELTARLGVRLITVDRPGIGLTDPMKELTLFDRIADIEEVADSLKLDRFAVLGWSGGAPFALAAAHALGDRVTRAGIAGGFGPFERSGFRHLAPKEIRRVILILKAAPWMSSVLAKESAKQLHGEMRGAMHGGEALASSSDESVLAQGRVRENITRGAEEAFRQGHEGVAADMLLVFRFKWGFKPEEVHRPVELWYGEEDRMTPVEVGRGLASILPDARLRVTPRAGHLLHIKHWEEILETLTGARAPEVRVATPWAEPVPAEPAAAAAAEPALREVAEVAARVAEAVSVEELTPAAEPANVEERIHVAEPAPVAEPAREEPVLVGAVPSAGLPTEVKPPVRKAPAMDADERERLRAAGFLIDDDEPQDRAPAPTEEEPAAAAVEAPVEAAVVEEAPVAAVVEEAPVAAVLDEALEAAVVDEAPEAAVVEEPPEAAVVEESPEGAVLEEAPVAAVVEEPPEAAIVEEAQEDAPLEEAPVAAVVEAAPEVVAQDLPEAALVETSVVDVEVVEAPEAEPEAREPEAVAEPAAIAQALSEPQAETDAEAAERLRAAGFPVTTELVAPEEELVSAIDAVAEQPTEAATAEPAAEPYEVPVAPESHATELPEQVEAPESATPPAASAAEAPSRELQEEKPQAEVAEPAVVAEPAGAAVEVDIAVAAEVEVVDDTAGEPLVAEAAAESLATEESASADEHPDAAQSVPAQAVSGIDEHEPLPAEAATEVGGDAAERLQAAGFPVDAGSQTDESAVDALPDESQVPEPPEPDDNVEPEEAAQAAEPAAVSEVEARGHAELAQAGVPEDEPVTPDVVDEARPEPEVEAPQEEPPIAAATAAQNGAAHDEHEPVAAEDGHTVPQPEPSAESKGEPAEEDPLLERLRSAGFAILDPETVNR
jgi:pimeloyl-ACP methyl ester carboxylesterase